MGLKHLSDQDLAALQRGGLSAVSDEGLKQLELPDDYGMPNDDIAPLKSLNQGFMGQKQTTPFGLINNTANLVGRAAIPAITATAGAGMGGPVGMVAGAGVGTAIQKVLQAALSDKGTLGTGQSTTESVGQNALDVTNSSKNAALMEMLLNPGVGLIANTWRGTKNAIADYFSKTNSNSVTSEEVKYLMENPEALGVTRAQGSAIYKAGITKPGEVSEASLPNYTVEPSEAPPAETPSTPQTSGSPSKQGNYTGVSRQGLPQMREVPQFEGDELVEPSVSITGEPNNSEGQPLTNQAHLFPRAPQQPPNPLQQAQQQTSETTETEKQQTLDYLSNVIRNKTGKFEITKGHVMNEVEIGHSAMNNGVPLDPQQALSTIQAANYFKYSDPDSLDRVLPGGTTAANKVISYAQDQLVNSGYPDFRAGEEAYRNGILAQKMSGLGNVPRLEFLSGLSAAPTLASQSPLPMAASLGAGILTAATVPAIQGAAIQYGSPALGALSSLAYKAASLPGVIPSMGALSGLQKPMTQEESGKPVAQTPQNTPFVVQPRPKIRPLTSKDQENNDSAYQKTLNDYFITHPKAIGVPSPDNQNSQTDTIEQDSDNERQGQ